MAADPKETLMAIYEIVKGPLPWKPSEVNAKRFQIVQLIQSTDAREEIERSKPPGPHRPDVPVGRRSF